MSLRDLQLRMQRHLLQAADDPRHATALGDAVADAPPLPVAERIAIYQHAYRSRLIDALADTHPALLQILGDEDFARAASGFIESQPSVHRSIRWYGREFSGYLKRTAPFEQQPIFAELASFEWTLSEVFDAPDVPSIERAAVQQVSPSRWSELRLSFHPSVRRLSLNWNTVPVWRAISEQETPPDPEATDSAGHWLLWRQNLKSHFRTLERDESAALDVALRGDCVAGVCAALSAHVPEPQIPLRVATFIAAWIDSEMVTAAAH